MIKGQKITSSFRQKVLNVTNALEYSLRSKRSIKLPKNYDNNIQDCPQNCESVGEWTSLDTSLDGTGDHENYRLWVNWIFNILVTFQLSDENIQCLQIRIKYDHSFAKIDKMNVQFLHRNHMTGNFHWGPSTKHGFHCFNYFGSNEQCPDFEWRTFKDCPEII